jgi:hypothetical protein
MTIVRGNYERKTILDFGKGKVSKNRIRQALRHTDVFEAEKNNDHTIYYDNTIRIGMYEICIIPKLKLGYRFPCGTKFKLKDYGGFSIEILERNKNYLKAIDCQKDNRFKEQKWATVAYTYDVRMKHLLEMILHCSRLNNLRIFN